MMRPALDLPFPPNNDLELLRPMIATLPDFLRYRSATDLIRLGRDNDGGYLLSEQDLIDSDILIGMGINDDWSFEEQFSKRKDIPVVAYDASVSKKAILQRLWRNPFSARERAVFRYWFSLYRWYRAFFRGKHRHVEKFVGWTSFGADYVSLSDVFCATSAKRLFLKIDIEGGEYRLLGDLLAHQERISGLVMEFHDCDFHTQRIEDFVRRFSLPLVHVHANNFAPVDEPSGLPLVMELTFGRNAPLGDAAMLPHPLDMPNKKTRAEIVLRFAGQ